MAIQVALNHKTVYKYDRLVTLGPQTIRLRPAPHCKTPVKSYSLKIQPPEHFLNWQQDPQSNYLARAVFPEKTDELSIEVDLVAEMLTINPFDFFLEPSAREFPFRYEKRLKKELRPYLKEGKSGPHLKRFLAGIDQTPRSTNDFLVELNQQVQQAVNYTIRMEPGVQSPEETLKTASGSCRDSGWLMVQILRRLGLAARFVSGYLIQLKPDVKPLEGPAGAEADFTDLHAWTEVFLPGAGWVGLDPTSGLFAAEGHLPLAASPEPQSASPITGTAEAAASDFYHEMSVSRIHEDPRVTKPYTEEQWSEINTLGDQIDADLQEHDVRLTMGGEPTFVSVDDMEGDEWNTAAVGPNKRRLAEELLRRLESRFADGALRHYGQGKWYPGEPLPRWALTCYWRDDGKRLWNDSRLMADTTTDYGHQIDDAERLINRLAERLGVAPKYAIAAYEDPLHYLQKERELPVNLTPEDNRLKRPEDRQRLRAVFDKGLNRPTGYVLPLERKWYKNRQVWQSGMWMVRGRHMFLTPGDSPIGLRLPLQSLPWMDPRHAPYPTVTDPMAPREELQDPERQRQTPPGKPVRKKKSKADREPKEGESADWVIRTALAVEPRDGRLHIFLPPTDSAEDFVDLLAGIEDAVAALETPVVLEGYTPPTDYRLSSLKVTPDPGVIEVNVQPAATWKELVTNITGVYDDAHESRLGTEKFMIDGRHSGTGGGNHFVLGGATPADSPFLRRPDLLRSMLAYWVNHPSLSYLFSGLFIGPTSQAPRVDETRADSLYELEIAFQQVDNYNGPVPPWLVDRIFRHLLVDVTGNTHRAEFCIDKLYSPDTATGRLGLLELRSFEMPPHARMSLTQQLLLRGLMAWFWREPYLRPPVSWGTRLHDEFMLPHYVSKDFHAVIEELKSTGYGFQQEWFAPHIEFRFPVLGRIEQRGIELELRTAIEPWNVLGEEGSPGGTARYVDSSVERLQVLVRGSLEDRYFVACNGRRLPLRPTGTNGEQVAGVRYRAWQPPSCLHPTIPVHTPLVFDLIDDWSGRAIGGCTYHVSHPGGRADETFPVNALAAETRRAARFFGFGHTPGPTTTPPAEVDPRFPATLDLRRAPRR